MATADAQKAAGNYLLYVISHRVIIHHILICSSASFPITQFIILYYYAFSDQMEKGFGTFTPFMHLNNNCIITHCSISIVEIL